MNLYKLNLLAVSKKLAETQLELGSKYESLIESANRLALGIEDDHNLISGSGYESIWQIKFSGKNLLKISKNFAKFELWNFYEYIYLEKDSYSYIHRKNVRLRGLPDLQDRALIDMFKELCTKKLGITLEDSDIDQALWNGPTQRDGTRFRGPYDMDQFSTYQNKKNAQGRISRKKNLHV